MTNSVPSDATLAQQLARLGVRHLRVFQAGDDAPPLAVETLIARLAQHPDPRFREALIVLFIRRPAYAALVTSVASRLEPADTEVLRHMYTAAVYLQRLWRGALSIYLGDFPLLPDYFGLAFFGLPAPDEYFGEAGLRALADVFKARTGDEWLSAYDAVMNLLLEQLRLEVEMARASLAGIPT